MKDYVLPSSITFFNILIYFFLFILISLGGGVFYFSKSTCIQYHKQGKKPQQIHLHIKQYTCLRSSKNVQYLLYFIINCPDCIFTCKIILSVIYEIIRYCFLFLTTTLIYYLSSNATYWGFVKSLKRTRVYCIYFYDNPSQEIKESILSVNI